MEGAFQGPSPAPQLLLPSPGPPEGTAAATLCPVLPPAAPGAASSFLCIPEHQQAPASPGLQGEEARASPCACSGRISPASHALGRRTCQSSSCRGFPSPGQERLRAGLL